jgi:hypothetical protein
MGGEGAAVLAATGGGEKGLGKTGTEDGLGKPNTPWVGDLLVAAVVKGKANRFKTDATAFKGLPINLKCLLLPSVGDVERDRFGVRGSNDSNNGTSSTSTISTSLTLV